MKNLLDYVREYGEKTFEQHPFTEVDAAVLCQLGYLKFEHIFIGEEAGSVMDCLTAPDRARLFDDDRFGDRQRKMLFEILFSRRYQNMRVGNVVSEKDDKKDLCFCAMIFYLPGSAPVVMFRGTDEYLVGWKEDFLLALRSPVPSQSMSVEYLTKAADMIGGKFFVCGHSKGGNLAVYSALNSPGEVRDNVKMIYNFDGPGFKSYITDMPEYEELRGRIMKIIPEQSFVGRLLQNAAACRVVDSDAIGVLQHDLFTWGIDDFGGFVYKYDAIQSAKMINNRLSENLVRLSDEQIEQFIDALFGILKAADITNLVDFKNNWLKNGRNMVMAYSDVDRETKKLIYKTVSDLL